MKSSEPARFASTYFAPSTCLRVSRPFVNNSLSTMACLFCSGHELAKLNRFRFRPQCPLRVNNGPDALEMGCLFYPRKRTPGGHRAMSEKCQTQTFTRLPDRLAL